MLGRIRAAVLTAAVGLFALGGLVQTAKADLIIDNTGGPDTGEFQPFGSNNTATYGQTFTVGPDTFLDSFSMFLRERIAGSGPLSLRGYLGVWTGTNISSIVFASSTIDQMNEAGDLQEFAFNPDIELLSGTTYVAFLSISELVPQLPSTFGMPIGTSIADGNFVFLNNGTNFGELQTGTWSSLTGLDAWFRASFTDGRIVEVPEPTTLVLFGAGLVGLGLMARRRKLA